MFYFYSCEVAEFYLDSIHGTVIYKLKPIQQNLNFKARDGQIMKPFGKPQQPWGRCWTPTNNGLCV